MAIADNIDVLTDKVENHDTIESTQEGKDK